MTDEQAPVAEDYGLTFANPDMPEEGWRALNEAVAEATENG